MSGRVKKTKKVPTRNFAGMNAEQIAMIIENDIRIVARQYKRMHTKKFNYENAATSTAALYLRDNQSLYRREDIQETRDVHHKWMIQMKTWFMAEVE